MAPPPKFYPRPAPAPSRPSFDETGNKLSGNVSDSKLQDSFDKLFSGVQASSGSEPAPSGKLSLFDALQSKPMTLASAPSQHVPLSMRLAGLGSAASHASTSQDLFERREHYPFSSAKRAKQEVENPFLTKSKAVPEPSSSASASNQPSAVPEKSVMNPKDFLALVTSVLSTSEYATFKKALKELDACKAKDSTVKQLPAVVLELVIIFRKREMADASCIPLRKHFARFIPAALAASYQQLISNERNDIPKEPEPIDKRAPMNSTSSSSGTASAESIDLTVPETTETVSQSQTKRSKRKEYEEFIVKTKTALSQVDFKDFKCAVLPMESLMKASADSIRLHDAFKTLCGVLWRSNEKGEELIQSYLMLLPEQTSAFLWEMFRRQMEQRRGDESSSSAGQRGTTAAAMDITSLRSKSFVHVE